MKSIGIFKYALFSTYLKTLTCMRMKSVKVKSTGLFKIGVRSTGLNVCRCQC